MTTNENKIKELENKVRELEYENNSYKEAFLLIEKALIDVRLGNIYNTDMFISRLTSPQPVQQPAKDEEKSFREEFELWKKNKKVEDEKACKQAVEELNNLSVTIPPQLEPTEESVKPKRGRPKGSKNKNTSKRSIRNRKVVKKVDKPEEEVIKGGSVFKTFKDLDVDNINKNSKELSAYFASEEDIELAKEEEKHPNKFSAFGAVLNNSEV